jgi:hypothetical protein
MYTVLTYYAETKHESVNSVNKTEYNPNVSNSKWILPNWSTERPDPGTVSRVTEIVRKTIGYIIHD